MTPARDLPLGCRLNLRHKWQIVSTEDGERYWTCKVCGKEKSTRGAPAGPPAG